ncbi:hypothetical protein LQF12_10345 [Ruania suaedae]|uniref:hypothetical protein n=1 Tax=Ruania suaedae TaxID=2897774 RepID=UPI001E3F1A90|nr:hypothetical protein [Ruania suaedae]UFU01915.1 hypothetical protein LQF12_10345 [Ruania suaedae]
MRWPSTRRPRDSRGRPALSRPDIDAVVQEWTEAERFAFYSRWVARYLPIWHAAYARYAEQTGVDAPKRELFTQRMDELIERGAAVRAGERVVKARLNETQSAISALTAHAPNAFGVAPWTTRIRTAALTARHFLQVCSDGAKPSLVTAGVYTWAEIESGFPGDSAAMLMMLTPKERASAGPGVADAHHLVYARPCQEHGLAEEGRAVYDAVAAIMSDPGRDPGPFPLDDGFWVTSPSPARAQQAQAYEKFHGRQAPPWMR